MLAPCVPLKPTRDELLWMLRAARAPRLRSIRQFAEQEIIIPDGPFANRQFKCERQPFSRILFDLIDGGQGRLGKKHPRWNRFFFPGCTQSGKSLKCFVIPVLYHLFEQQEKVICGVPDMDMAGDKWREDLLPVIEKTKYRELLPTKGAGSRGGKFESITFLNGTTLKFMSSGGGDKARAGYTARVLCVTEVDGFDVTSDSSREADKFTQLEARTLAHGENKCIYGECTVSIETGRIWTEWINGTKTELYLPCPHCRKHVQLGRETLAGWQDAQTEEDARKAACHYCPSCGQAWTEQQRRQANLAAVPVHRGQEIRNGKVTGPLPETRTLGFRWHAAHNFFYDTGYVGAEEWNASRAVDEENAEKKLRQFLWTLPHIPASVDATPLTYHGIMGRTAMPIRGLVPNDTDFLTIGLDIGKFLCHWVLLAFRATGRLHVVEYGRLECASDQLGEERAIMTALCEFRDVVEHGWLVEAGGDAKEQLRSPDQVFVDSRYQRDVIFQFCSDSGDPWMPSQGYGVEQRTGTYSRPKELSKTTRLVGEEYHMTLDAAYSIFVAHVNADHWKSWVHQRMAQEVKAYGALTLFKPSTVRDHMAFAKHMTSEKRVEEFEHGKGLITKWRRVHRNNHYFDAIYNACAAGHFAGFELLEDEEHPASEGTG